MNNETMNNEQFGQLFIVSLFIVHFREEEK